MEKLPKIEFKLTKLEKFLEIMGYLTLAALWLSVIINYFDLPDQIPIHFNGVGKADDYRGKNSIFIFPIICTFLFLVVSLRGNNPEDFIYKVKITEENREALYRNQLNFIRVSKIMVSSLFLLISMKTTQLSKSGSEELGIGFLLLCAAIILLPVGYFTYKSYKLKQ
jgi:uncharacterized membrane protein